MTKIGNPKKSM